MANLLGMSPEYWSTDIQMKFLEMSIFDKLVNKNYQGDIMKGNTVHIPFHGKYTPNRGLFGQSLVPAPQSPNVTEQTLTVDQEFSLNVGIDAKDMVSYANLNPGTMPAVLEGMVYGMVEQADTYFMGLYDKVAPQNRGGILGTDLDPILVNMDRSDNGGADKLWETIIKMRMRIRQSHAPTDQLYIVVPPDALACMKVSKQFIFNPNGSGQNLLAIGEVTGSPVDGVHIIESTYVDSDEAGVYHLFMGAVNAVTYVQKLNYFRFFPAGSQARYTGDEIQMEQWWGMKVMRPDACATATISVTLT